MTLKKIGDNFTEQGWSRLRNRLEHDGLLSGQEEEKSGYTIFMSRAVKIAISVAAILCICFVSVWIFRGTDSSNTDTFVLENGQGANTLVSMLEDGSVVYLSEQSLLECPNIFQPDKREVVLNGDAFFEISKNKERPFFINTEQVVIEVLGTAFNVNSKGNSSFSLSVRNGEVKVILKKTGQAVYVKAGEKTYLKSGYLQLSKDNTGKFDDYMKQIHFKDERLADIIQIINMNSDSVRLTVMPDLSDRLLTVSFLDNTPETMAKLICLALNLKYTRQDNNIILISREEK